MKIKCRWCGKEMEGGVLLSDVCSQECRDAVVRYMEGEEEIAQREYEDIEWATRDRDEE